MPTKFAPPYLKNTSNAKGYSDQKNKNGKRKKGSNLVSLDGLKYPGKNVMTSRKLFTRYINGVLVSFTSPNGGDFSQRNLHGDINITSPRYIGDHPVSSSLAKTAS